MHSKTIEVDLSTLKSKEKAEASLKQLIDDYKAEIDFDETDGCLYMLPEKKKEDE